MKSFIWKVITLAALFGVARCTGMAQSAATAPAQQNTVASTDPSAASASTADTVTAQGATTAARPAIQLTVDQKIEAMEKRIEQLEGEVKDARAAALADSSDTAAMKEAEKAMVAGSSATPTAASAAVQSAGPAAAPAAPEINAQVTTKGEPFPGDWTWVNNNGHAEDSPMATKYFTPEFRSDANYTIDMNHPEDDTMGGSTETFRSDEWQLEQISIGGDFRIQNVRGRFLCMCGGLWSVTTTRNDGSVVRGSWDLSGAYKYIAEGWGGYHWNYAHGVNLDAGIFVSYIGLFSYYNFDNWAYQPSFVSSNTPWFFNGLRLQYFPTAKLKIEPWFVNGWQTYARPNGKPGLGGQVLWRPVNWFELVSNNYGLGEDDALEQQGQLTGGTGATRSRVHTDDSIELKYYDKPQNLLDKMAFTVTGDMGCEYGGGGSSFGTANGALAAKGVSSEYGTTDTYNGGVNCHSNKDGKPKQDFLGWMMYQRFWFKKDVFAITVGGGQMSNTGRYLTLLPPINGATAATGTPYYTENPGDRAQMHDGTFTFDYMPAQFITFRWETGYRYSDTPYWTGHRGITPPGGVNGAPSQYACANGSASGYGYEYSIPSGNTVAGLPYAEAACFAGGNGTGANGSAIWWPDLRTNQTVATMAIMVRF